MTDLEKEYYTEAQVASFLGISVKTLRNRHSAGKNHPPRIAGTKKYSIDAFRKWLKAREEHEIARRAS